LVFRQRSKWVFSFAKSGRGGVGSKWVFFFCKKWKRRRIKIAEKRETIIKTGKCKTQATKEKRKNPFPDGTSDDRNLLQGERNGGRRKPGGRRRRRRRRRREESVSP
jgi:hypothetical protein